MRARLSDSCESERLGSEQSGVGVQTCVELFTGCGGLALGLSRAGFRALRMVERDKHSVANVLHNRERGVEHISHWPIHLGDVRMVDWAQNAGVDLVAGGPPCQPFSIGGRHRGHEDNRDMWPEAVRAIREIAPRGFLFENVRGLVRRTFADYLDWVLASLANPQVQIGSGETRSEHLRRLKSAGTGLYRVGIVQVNAADYGAAQSRHRVVIWGIRRSLTEQELVLKPSHSRERLLWDQWVSGEYWRRHSILSARGPRVTDAPTVKRLRRSVVPPEGLPWRTLRDALAGLGEPNSGRFPNHKLQPGARSYPGHTGSHPDAPAKALKAGVHGVPGGENTIALEDGSVRYLTVREAARLQGLPDNYEFVGSWSENMRQLGNAVPTELAEAAAVAIGTAIAGKSAVTRNRHAA